MNIFSSLSEFNRRALPVFLIINTMIGMSVYNPKTLGQYWMKINNINPDGTWFVSILMRHFATRVPLFVLYAMWWTVTIWQMKNVPWVELSQWFVYSHAIALGLVIWLMMMLTRITHTLWTGKLRSAMRFDSIMDIINSIIVMLVITWINLIF